MAQHVSMDLERQLSSHAEPFYELLGTIDGEGRLALGQEHEVGMGMLAPERPQEPQLVTLQAMNARRAVLGAADIDGRGVQVNLLPAKVNQLADAQRMPEGHQDQKSVTDRIAAVAGGVDQLGNLGLGQILAGNQCFWPDHHELSAFQTGRGATG